MDVTYSTQIPMAGPRRGWRVGLALCILAAAVGCKQNQPVHEPCRVQGIEEVNSVQPRQVSGEEPTEDIRELERLRNEADQLEARVVTLKQKIVDLTEANRRLAAQFQGIELAEMAAAIESGTTVRDAVLGTAPTTGKGQPKTIYLWDKPGGYAAGARVVGQAEPGDRVVIAEETVAAGKRWCRIYTTTGTAFEYGWVASRLVSEIPAEREETNGK